MKYLRLLVLMSMGSPALYVGSYLLTVEACLEQVAGASHHAVPRYSVGGKGVEQFYAPLHKLDTKLRTKYWHRS